jgi:hypothetical protein
VDAHGQCAIKIENKTLILTLIGQFNKAGFEQALCDAQNLVLQHKLTEFAALVDLTEWGLSEPGIEEVFKKHRPWFMEHGQKYEVLVVGTSNLKKMETLKYFVGYDEQLSIKYCANIEGAEKWLKQKYML